MKNSDFNAAFLAWVAKEDNAAKNAILQNIANHYGITVLEATDELIDEDAEHILDYVTGPTRRGASFLCQKFNAVKK